MKRVKSKPEPAGRQMAMMFDEDLARIGKPEDIPALRGKVVAFDVETTGLAWWGDKIIGIGLHCPQADYSKYIPALDDETRKEIKFGMEYIASDPDTQLVAHNIKFDAHFLDIPLWRRVAQIHDTAVEAHLIDSRLQKSLKDLENHFLHTDTKRGALRNYSGARIQEMPLPLVAEYCINDARVTLDLHNLLQPELEKWKLGRLYRKDMRYVRYLQRIERHGMKLDIAFIKRAIARFAHNLELMEADLFKQIRALAQAKGLPDPLQMDWLSTAVHKQAVLEAQKKGKRIPKFKRLTEFNWRSDDQLSVVIYEGIGHPRPVNPFADADGVDRTKFATRGKYNATMTSGFLLMEKGDHPLGALLMDMRETNVLYVTLNKWLELGDKDEIIHTNLNPTGTRTGRLSSSDPNLQNVAGKERTRETQSVYSGGTIREEEYNLRLGLVARPGHVFLSIDHKQQEGRLFAVLSQDPDMIAAVKAREDIHGLVAKLVWADDIARDPSCFKVRREWAKTLSFGMLYGMTRGSMQHRLNKTQEESEAIMAQYQGRFHRVMPFLHETVELCKRHHYLRYWSGRIWREDNTEFMYKGTNAQVQGGGADLISLAVMRIQDWLDAQPRSAGEVLEIADIIHDEVLCEIPYRLLREANTKLLQIMELEDVLKIPFLADSKCGDTYGSMYDVDEWIKDHPQYFKEDGGGSIF